MLTASEKKNLKQFLALAPEPEYAFSYDELLGYMFGLAMTPEVILPSEWMPLITGGEMVDYDSMEQAERLNSCLIKVYNKFISAFQKKSLKFPFQIEKLEDEAIEKLYLWVAGLEEALALRAHLWNSEEYPQLTVRKRDELDYSMMTIQALLEPEEFISFFEDMPEELAQEAFPGIDLNSQYREIQLQTYLMTVLPLSVDTLLNHAVMIEQERQQKHAGPGSSGPAKSLKIGRNEPCPCSSGKKYKKCCGSGSGTQLHLFESAPPKKSNVIKVDFPKHGRKKTLSAPIYQLKVGLQGAKPPIWRRIQVPGHATLAQLHTIIQISMGWDDYHLHEFTINETCYSAVMDDDDLGMRRVKNENDYTLDDIAADLQSKFLYIYDYGDYWLHQIAIEKTLPAKEGESFPRILAGRRSCPPEDCGGIHSYMHMLQILADPEDHEYEELRDWLGDEFDPADFDKIEIKIRNEQLKNCF